jgi:N-acetylglucosaminyldiphosphoundecaprenol N-acetyl-beta-D-mannosaminyltransferase
MFVVGQYIMIDSYLLSAAAYRQEQRRRTGGGDPAGIFSASSVTSPMSVLVKTEPLTDEVRDSRVLAHPLFGVKIHAVNMRQAVETICDWTASRERGCRFVVTPNVDHVVLLRHHLGLQQAYRAASLVLADGWPLVLASRLLSRPLPERVAGSDLVPALFASGHPLRVFLLGAGPGVADRAARRIHDTWPSVSVVGTCSPPLGFESQPEQTEKILASVNQSEADLLVLGLGAPKQELWIHAHHGQLRVPAALCVGATIDFLAGHRRRAPLWMQRAGLEWFYRMIKEPRRLAGRYAYDASVFPQLLWREIWKNI